MSMSDIRAFFGGISAPARGKEKGAHGKSAAGKGKNKTPEKNVKKAKSPKETSREKPGGKGRCRNKAMLVSDSDDEVKEIKKQKKPRIKDSDSEEEPLPHKMRKLSEEKKTKSRKAKKSTYFDSDEEEVIPNTLKKAAEESEKSKPKDKKSASSSKDVTMSPTKPKPQPKSSPAKPAKPAQPVKPVKPVQAVSAADFFGSAPVERTERKVSATKRKQPADEENSSTQDPKRNGFGAEEEHDTEEVQENLADLDRKDLEQPSKKSPKKEAKPTLASKLAQAAAAAENIPETPERITTLRKSPRKGHTPKKQEKPSPVKEPPSKKTKMEASEITESITNPRKGKKQEKTSPAREPMSKKTKTEASEITESTTNPKKGRTPIKQKKASPVKETPSKETKIDSKTPGSSNTEVEDDEIIPPSLEKKKSSYRSFMQRGGPTALGSKPIPEGEENCLEGLTFVITGVLESMERETAQDLIQRHGGRVTGSISKKTSYIIVGDEAGETKLKKARDLGTKRLDEDGLIELVKTRPGKNSSAQSATQTKQPKKSRPLVTPESSQDQEWDSSQSQSQKLEISTSTLSPATQSPTPPPASQGNGCSLLWVDKYKPRTCRQIIGQQGEKSNMNKLKKWLRDWHENRQKPKPKGSFFNKDPEGVSFKAALLSGAPGVGKTTTSTLVCQELGFTYVEMNASDQRSKKILEQSLASSTSSKTMDEFGKGRVADGKHHVLIMDEVDGMAGNEDRGGIQELIAMIKNSKIPIICMCNDRHHPKIRSLSNYCFDLRFQKPRVEQVKGAMMTIAFKEGLKIPPQAMEQVIVGANQDLRQVLYNLSMWTAKEKSMSYDQAKADASNAQKDIKLGPFDIIKRLLTSEGSRLSLVDKSDLFFHNYSFVPLFVQENYLTMKPYKSGGNLNKTLELVSQTADSLCDGDLVEKRIRSSQSWNLLPMQAIYSCVIPSVNMMGGMGGKIEFPQWLGKNSRYGKFDRILQELQTHMRLSASTNKMAINLDYIPYLRRVLTRPLMTQEPSEINEGVSRVVQLMDDYDLTKEDWDSVMEVGQFDGHRDPVASIPSKVKAAFTRTYNKESHKTPYALQTMSKKSRGRGGGEAEGVLIEEGDERLEAEEPEKEEEDNIENDAMIKAKKKPKPSTSGKGKGKGKGADNKMDGSEPVVGKGKGKGKNRKT